MPETGQDAGYAEAEMPRFFFHLRSEDNFMWDDEDVDLPDPSDSPRSA
jgi:hypothetical protein